ncbi:hypothetical protein [Spirosoma knui]
MKPMSVNGPVLAAQLLQQAIEHYERNPNLRRQSGIDLKMLAEATKVRRRLLRQRPR